MNDATDMLNEEFYLLSGEPQEAGSLSVPKAVELVQALTLQGLPYARLINCWHIENIEIVVVDVEPEVPQYPEHDIRSAERVAIFFTLTDLEHPTVWALRKDFPLVPHLNFGVEGVPRSLCLYQTSYADLKPAWTAAALLGRIQHWLSQTARGELHETDQALEPAFYASNMRLVLPSIFFAPDAANTFDSLFVRLAGAVLGQNTYIASPASAFSAKERQQAQFVSFVYTAPPQVHGLIQQQPQTLSALQAYLSEADVGFTHALRGYLLDLKDTPDFDREHKLLIIVRLPRQRRVAGPVESTQVWGFASSRTLAEIGTDLGIWELHEKVLARLLPIDTTRNGQRTPLELLNPISALTREGAAAYNGLRSTKTRFVAIGAGSLGSQVVNNLVRAGQGNWIWLDEDQYLPHNAARHALPGSLVGQGKAQAMVSLLKETYEGADLQAISVDVLQLASTPVKTAFSAAEVVLDMSASVAVARHVALNVETPARRLSLFLNPSGTDLVLLAEPQDRSLWLDHMEMEYYRALLRNPDLQGHLFIRGQPIRYSHACRDVSVQLPQEQVALLAAVGARAVREAVARPGGRIKLWRTQPDLSVSAFEVEVSPYAEVVAGDWTIAVSHQLLGEMQDQRQARLPNETGGVLVGVFDTQHRRVYIVDHIPSPADSTEWPTAYYRGVEGVPEALSRISECTGRQVVYAGEWHSHPDRCGIHPSEDDRKLFAWLQYHRRTDGLPALMAIAGERGTTGWYMGDLTMGSGEYRMPE